MSYCDSWSNRWLFSFNCLFESQQKHKAATVCQLFIESVSLQSSVCSNKGGENVNVARYILSHPLRGQGRRSHITGRSVHNQRIEQLWRDVFFGCTSIYYDLLTCMEVSGMLDPVTKLICMHFITYFFPASTKILRNLQQLIAEHQ